MVGYCFDTSALIECWTRSYPPDVFPGLWDKFGDLAAHGAIVSPDEVQVEIGRQDDGLKKWTTDRPHMFVPLDTGIQQAARDVLAAFPLLVKAFSTRNQADPFVIATAKVRGLTLVTEERSGTPSRPRIPDVCKSMGLQCIGVMTFIREQGWTF